MLLAEKDTARVLVAFPQLLSMSIADDLRPTVAWLLETGVAPAKVRHAPPNHTFSEREEKRRHAPPNPI